MILTQSADAVQGSFYEIWYTIASFLPAILAAIIIFIIVFLVASLEILGLDRVTIFLQTVVLLYLPNVFVAALILILGAVVAEVVRNLVLSSARAAGAHGASLAATVAKWAIWVTAILAALNQLGVASEFVQTLFTGIVVAASLAFGLAFGLGGKDAAARTIERVRSEISHGN